MRVRYAPTTDDKPVPLLKKGTIYDVLEIHVGNDDVVYRILTEDKPQTPTLHSAMLFEIVSNRIPSSWVVSMGRARGFYIEMAPARWTGPGFWEDYFNQDPKAEKIFEQERQKMLSEESR
jgi:hypothetical protein